MKHFLNILLITIPMLIFGQNKHLTIGIKDNGICFGNSIRNNGVRFNLLDKDVEIINGVNVAVSSKSQISNGINLGLVWNENTICNGIVLNGLVGESEKANGIVISGLGYGANQINGLEIGGFSIVADTLNGLFMSPFSIAYWNGETIKLINGVTVGGIIGSVTEQFNGASVSVFNNYISKLNGVSIGMINEIEELKGMTIGVFNRSKNTRGVQSGIWNVSENNKIFKRMPLINFNFRKL